MWQVPVRGLTGEGEEFACNTVDVCAGGLRINLARPLAKGENLVLYIEDIGRVEGVVVRVLNEIGYAVEFRVPPRKRDKIADALTWLVNKDRLGLTTNASPNAAPAAARSSPSSARASPSPAPSPTSRSSASPSRPPAPAR